MYPGQNMKRLLCVACLAAVWTFGRPPDLATVRPDLVSGFGPFFERAFAHDPARRHVDAEALASDLIRLLAQCG